MQVSLQAMLLDFYTQALTIVQKELISSETFDLYINNLVTKNSPVKQEYYIISDYLHSQKSDNFLLWNMAANHNYEAHFRMFMRPY